MKKKMNNLYFKISAAAVLLVIAGAIVWILSDTIFKSGYDSSAATKVKFEKLEKWIPTGIDFAVVADAPRALSNANVKEKLLKIANNSEDGSLKDIASALLANHEAVGMTALFGRFGNGRQIADTAAVVQGNFSEDELVSSVRTILTAGRAGLAAEKIGDKTIYMESNSHAPFAFVIFDKEHMAIGSKNSLVSLFFEKGDTQPQTAETKSDQPFFSLPKSGPYPVIFGSLKIGHEITGALPEGMPAIDSVNFESADGAEILAHIPCADAVQAEKLRMFLEGMRSLLIIQEDTNTTAILRNVSITAGETDVTIKGGM